MIKNILDRSVGAGSTFKKTESLTNSREFQKKYEEEKIQSKVSQIQDQIQNGEYKIDLKKTSEKMALNLLNL